MERFLLSWAGLLTLAAVSMLVALGLAFTPPGVGLALSLAAVVLALGLTRPWPIGPILRRTPIALAVLSMLTLGACATVGTVASSTVKDEQAGYFAEAGLKAVRIFGVAGADAGGLKGARAARAADWLGRSHSAVGVVRAAYLVGSAGMTELQAVAALKVMADAQAVIAARDLPPAPASSAPAVSALAVLFVSISAAPQLGGLVEEARAVARSKDPLFIRDRTLALAAENDAAVEPAIARLRAAAGG